jgi:serine/threonine-protein kinase RsbW
MQIALKKDFSSVDRLLAFIRRFAAENGVSESDCFSVSVIAEELFTNMVKYNPDNRDDVALGLEKADAEIVIRLTDHEAAPFDITRAPKIDPSVVLKRGTPGQLGLHLVRQMAASIDYQHENGITVITVRRRLENSHAGDND